MYGFFEAVPANCGLTFVVISHSSPERPSLLTELLQPRSMLVVSEIFDGQQPAANHVYVPPSWAQVTLQEGVFRLTSCAGIRERSRRVDVFLTSMASAMRTHCAGVVLSGCGTDGSAGIEAVAAHGGLTLAQAPATAEESGMPCCAIATGQVQQVDVVERMPALIAQHFRTLGLRSSTQRVEAS